MANRVAVQPGGLPHHLRWAFYGAADLHIAVITGMTLAFLAACLTVLVGVQDRMADPALSLHA